jgi:hypothetical protein
VRLDTEGTRTPYELARDDIGQLIYMDYASPITVQFTYREENTERYPADFVIALSFLLASYIAPSVSGGDPKQMGDRALGRYERLISRAERNSAREGQVQDRPQEAEMIRVRDANPDDCSFP